jgi:hypothetical protein
MNGIRTKVAALVLILIATLSAPWSAKAEPVSGFYLGAGAGLNIMQQVPITSLGNGDCAVLSKPFQVRGSQPIC